MRALPRPISDALDWIRPRLRAIGVFALAWVAVACLGYGLALRDYAEEESTGFRAHDFGGSYQTYEGKISSVSEGLLWGEPSFRLARVGRSFVLPLDLIEAPDPLQTFREHVKKGVFVRVHARMRDDVVVGLWTNWSAGGSADSIELVRGQDLPRRVLLLRSRMLRERGDVMVLLGLALVPAGLGAFWGGRRLARKLRRSG